ncbi:MAG: metal ABC transporter permease [Tannerellaceae bacterium]|jgi:zinc transport system permease protein|nr:metal ABC transporter permease [Tannerellaceae bacterium]
MEILHYSFFQHALAGCLLTSLTCGLVGTYVVIRRLSFISGGITHASFGGLGLGFFLGINPVLTALGFALLAAWGVEWAGQRGILREDSAIAGLWSVGMAIGALFLFLSPGYAPNLSGYLFGSILTITDTDLYLSALTAAILVGTALCYHRQIIYSAFDPDFAHTKNLPVSSIRYLLALLTAFTIVLAIRLVGIMLLLSLLTIPPSTVNLFTSDYRRIAIGSIVLALAASTLGLILSVVLNIPSGAGITLTLAFIFVAAKACRSLPRKPAKP